jgi:hypothetical protein
MRADKAPSAPARFVLALLVALILILVGARTFGAAGKLDGNIDVESVQVARDLLQGVRSPTSMVGTTAHDRPPGLAVVLTLFAMLDARVEHGLSCSLGDRAACRAGLFTSVLGAQYAAAVIVFLVVLVLAWRLSRTWSITLITSALSLIALRPADAAGMIRPMIWYQLLLALYLLLALLAHQKRSAVFALAAGVALGLSALFEPLTALLIPFAAPLCFLPSDGGSEPMSRAALRGVSVMAGAVLSIALVAAAIGQAYDINGAVRHVARHLAERTAFNGMDMVTWAAALTVPIPLVGDWLQPLFGDAGQGVGAARAGSIASDGMIRLFETGMAQGGSPVAAALWLLREQITLQVGAYLWSLPPMVSRGIWAGGGVVALFGLFHIPRMLAYARIVGRIGDLFVVVLPIACLFIVNTLFTGNAYWLNPMLPFLYCYAIAYVAGGL